MMVPSIVWQLVIVFLVVVAAIQVAYYLYFFTRLAFYKKKQKQTNQEYPVSVIICGRDEAANFAKNLPGVLVQQYRTTHEVIVVNDNSADESKYVLDELRKTFKHLVPVELTQEALMIRGKKFPLSMGIKTAKHEVVLLSDADCIPASDEWIQKMQDGFTTNTEIVLGYGAYKKRPGVLNKIIRFETFHTALQYLSYALADMPYMGVGRNLAYKKTLFFKNKGFSSINQIPGGDDDLFINQVAKPGNTAIMIDEEAFTISEPKRTWNEWMRQKTRHLSTAQFYKTHHKNLLGLYAVSHGLFYPLLITAACTGGWAWAVGVYLTRLLVQGVIFYKAMYKLKEQDLWKFYPLFDVWMFAYYFIFITALWKKPSTDWN